MNTFGNTFRLTTFGESHGPAVGGIIDGCPAGWVLDEAFIKEELRRRREGDSNDAQHITSRQEADEVEWLSGIYEGKTLGTPLTFIIRNKDCHSEDYAALKDCFRPGHADYAYQAKYGFRDPRGGGRASGRETAARVVSGAIAKQILRQQGIIFTAVNDSRHITCTIQGLPAGIGEPIFDRLNARLAYAMLSIPSAMAFAMGEEPDDWNLPKEQFADAWVENGEGGNLTQTNHCGGIQGGISNGMNVVFHVGFHAPVTNPDGMVCRREDGTLQHVEPHGRHDSDHGSRLPVIVEAMAAITIADLIF